MFGDNLQSAQCGFCAASQLAASAIASSLLLSRVGTPMHTQATIRSRSVSRPSQSLTHYCLSYPRRTLTNQPARSSVQSSRKCCRVFWQQAGDLRPRQRPQHLISKAKILLNRSLPRILLLQLRAATVQERVRTICPYRILFCLLILICFHWVRSRLSIA